MRNGAGVGAGAEIIFSINIYCSQFGGTEKQPLRHISYGTLLYNSFQWQYRSEAGAGAGAGAGAEVMDKGGAGAENKKIRLHNTAFLPPLEEFYVVLEISHDKFKKSKLQVLY